MFLLLGHICIEKVSHNTKRYIMKATLKLLLLLMLSISAYQARSQCNANFSSYVSLNGDVSFYPQQIDSNLNITMTWDFGDGNTATSPTQYPVTHTYVASGTYIVCLHVHDSQSSCDVTRCDTVVINKCQGAAQFSSAIVGYGLQSFATSAVSIPGATMHWDFGDGSTSTDIAPVHQFVALPETTTVCLIVTLASAGCADTSCQWNYVDCNQFQPSFDTSVVGINPLVLGLHVHDPQPGYTYTWNFGDGSSVGTGADTLHAYNASGSYTISLFAADPSLSCATNSSQTFDLNRCNLNVYADVVSNGVNATFYTYITDTTNVHSPSYYWSFPGGTPSSSTSANANVTYPQLGTETACVYVSNAGCTDTVCKTFTLTTPTYNISGVITKGGNGTCGTVFLIQEDTVGHLALVDSVTMYVDTTCSGYYFFENKLAGTYYVKAALLSGDPDYTNYLPTYYNNELYWANATAIDITNGTAGGVNIDLIAGNNPGGPGFVGGWVSQGANLTAAGGPADTHRSTNNAGDPLPDIQINLLNAADGPVAYTYTDAQGHYQFSNLAYGTYHVYAEELNKAATKIPVTISGTNPSVSNVNLSINNDGTVSGISEVRSIELNSVYPNPVITVLELNVSSKQATEATVKINDMLGRIEMEQQVKLAGGANKLNVNMENLANGVYQLSIQTGNKTITYKVVKSK
jgi:PKD repeat protein